MFVKNGTGKRHIGHKIDRYEDGILVLIGPDIPHLPFLNLQYEDNYEIVVQMGADFLAGDWLQKPEFWAIKKLLDRSHQGIIFGQHTKVMAEQLLNAVVEATSIKRLLILLDLLNDLAITTDYEFVNPNLNGLAIERSDFNRLKEVYALVADEFREDISLEEAAFRASMTVPAFCRLFKKLTSRTFTAFVNEYRISEAIKLLHSEDMPISEVAFACGYNSVSYFSRQFKKVTNLRPKDYRNSI